MGAVDLRDIDLALASYPEAQWPELAGPVLLARLERAVGLDPDELAAAVRRATYLAAAGGDPHEGDDPHGPAVAFLASELVTRERRSSLADALRAEVARALGQHLPRVETVLRQLAAPTEDPSHTWRLFCAALYALNVDDEDDAGDGGG